MGEPDEVFAKSDELEKAEAMDEKVKAKKNEADFCISSAESAPRLTSTGGEMDVQKLMPVIPDPGFDFGELPWNVRRVKDCELILMEKAKASCKRKVSRRESEKRQQFICF